MNEYSPNKEEEKQVVPLIYEDASALELNFTPASGVNISLFHSSGEVFRDRELDASKSKTVLIILQAMKGFNHKGLNLLDDSITCSEDDYCRRESSHVAEASRIHKER